MLGVVRVGALFEAGDPGVVDEGIQATVLLQHIRHRRGPVGLAADIESRGSSIRPEPSGKRVAGLGVDIRDPDHRALGEESLGDRRADPAGRPGHQRNLSDQSLHSYLQSRCRTPVNRRRASR